MNLTLNSRNGHLLLPSNHLLVPDLQPSEVATLAPTYPPVSRDLGNGWMWYDLRFEQSSSRLSISLGFNNQRLRIVIFGLPAEQPIHGWETYNEAQERQQTAVYDAWLTRQVGTDRQFAWGSVWAEYDPRNGTSSLGVRYV